MIFMTDCMNSVSGNKGSSRTQPDKKEYVFETTNKYIDYFILLFVNKEGD